MLSKISLFDVCLKRSKPDDALKTPEFSPHDNRVKSPPGYSQTSISPFRFLLHWIVDGLGKYGGNAWDS
jgi:hypothetical protein